MIFSISRYFNKHAPKLCFASFYDCSFTFCNCLLKCKWPIHKDYPIYLTSGQEFNKFGEYCEKSSKKEKPCADIV